MEDSESPRDPGLEDLTEQSEAEVEDAYGVKMRYLKESMIDSLKGQVKLDAKQLAFISYKKLHDVVTEVFNPVMARMKENEAKTKENADRIDSFEGTIAQNQKDMEVVKRGHKQFDDFNKRLSNV